MGDFILRLKAHHPKKTIRNKIIFIDVVVFGMCFCLLILFMSRQYSGILTERTKTAAGTNLRMQSVGINEQFRKMEYVSDTLFCDSETSVILSNIVNSTDLEQIRDYYEYFPHLRDISKSAIDLGIKIYIDGGVFLSSEQRYLFNEDLIKGEPWYDEVNDANGKCVWVFDDEKKTVTVARVLKDVNYSYERLGLLTVELPVSQLDDLIANGDGNAAVLLYDGNSRPVASAFAEGLSDTAVNSLLPLSDGSDGNVRKAVDGEDSLISVVTLDPSGWKLASSISYKEITREPDRLTGLGLALSLIVVGLSVLACVVSLKSITKRIMTIGDRMVTIEKDNFSSLIEMTHEDELNIIEDRYNNMCERMRELIRELQEAENRKRESEMRVLQAQVNPHFLYNVLDTVNWMAIDNDDYEISDIVTKLGKFFRISLSDGREVITLAEEINLVSLYLDIQKARFRDYLECEYDIDESLKNCPCIKLILQPIVENSIKHGFRKDDLRRGVIKISCRLENNMAVIRISDNGRGFDGYKDLKIDERDQTGGYGLRNVRERLSVYYKDDYILNIRGKIDEGTTVTVGWPADESFSADITVKRSGEL